MFKELLDESEASKKINTKLAENSHFILSLKEQINTKEGLLAVTRRKIESFEYVNKTLFLYFFNKIYTFSFFNQITGHFTDDKKRHI